MEETNSIPGSPAGGLKPYLKPWGAIALSFGYAIGWGAFMMPGTAFLPGAGPFGTVLGVVLGALAMVVFAVNYHRMTLRCASPGGAYAFAQKTFGEDHGFLVAWFLWLTYIAILWANATATILVVRFTLGDAMQFGFHYVVAGFDVYFGEILLAVFMVLLGGGLCLAGRRFAVCMQTVFAAVLAVGVFGFFFFALAKHQGGVAAMGPAFTDDVNPVLQVMRILALMPWAFVGFEAITNSSAEFKFNAKKTAWILIVSIALSAAAYMFLALLPVLAQDAGHLSWHEYLKSISGAPGIKGVPVFAAAEHLLGKAGVALMSTMMVAAQITGIVAALVALSRLMHSMSKSEVLPGRIGALTASGTPRNALLFIAAVSCVIPFFGRTAIGWPVEVSSIGAAVAYGYTSAAAFRTCRDGGPARRFWARSCGALGVVLAVFFCLLLLIPNYISGSVLAAPSYLLLAVWCILGFLLYRKIFKVGHKRRFGRSVVVWNSLIITIIFASLMWVRQTAFENSRSILYECVKSMCGDDAAALTLADEKIGLLNVSMLCNAVVEMSLLLISLAIMISLVSILRRREMDLVAEKTRIEDMNKAKSYFFSTVSHDIRTPLNAIIGFSQMLKAGFKTAEEHDQAVNSILMSGKTLLKLINDVLDLSKLESGRMNIEPEPTDCRALIEEIADSFSVSAQKPHLDIRARVGEMPILMLDPQRLRQIAFNLMGNAVKFTPSGFVEVRAVFVPDPNRQDVGTFRLAVEDSGCGISEEDIQRIATPYVQVGTKESRHGGTGLGLAITRQLVNAMGGELTLSSTLGKGTTFRVVIPDVKVGRLPDHAVEPSPTVTPTPRKPPSSGHSAHRLLLVDDQKINLMVLKAMLSKIGDFDIALAGNGHEAMNVLTDPKSRPFDIVLTDMWMPEMDGAALVGAIRRNPRLATLPVYTITADVETTKNYSALGFTGILLKPVTLENLQTLLRENGFCD